MISTFFWKWWKLEVENDLFKFDNDDRNLKLMTLILYPVQKIHVTIVSRIYDKSLFTENIDYLYSQYYE